MLNLLLCRCNLAPFAHKFLALDWGRSASVDSAILNRESDDGWLAIVVVRDVLRELLGDDNERELEGRIEFLFESNTGSLFSLTRGGGGLVPRDCGGDIFC